MTDIREEILDIYKGLTKNNFATLGMPDAPMWDEPLVGVAAGDDDYYDFFKTHIGPFHMSPKELFATKYEDDVDVSNLRVVSIVFPQTDQTNAEQKSATIFPCDNWLVSRGEWEPLMLEFSGNLVQSLEVQGVRCVSVDLYKDFRRETSENVGMASVWSHRHTAFVAGLGTFGLSDGLITEKGKAIRLTSLVVEMPLETTPRTYKDPYEWCLFKQDGSCGACIQRCPVDAISKSGHDKNICSDYEDIAIEKYWPAHIEQGDYIFGCGLCQVKVPCQSKRP